MQERNESGERTGVTADDTMVHGEEEGLSRTGTRPKIDAAERELILRRFNDTSAPYPAEDLICGLFEAQVKRRPDAIAIMWGDEQFTYAQLNSRANQLAHALLNHHVRPDDRVGLLAERSAESVIGMLGILKAGAAYVPLDPNYPAERLEFMRQDSELVVLLTTSALAGRLANFGRPIIVLDSELSESTENVVTPGCTSRNLAYVIYTSGSTGHPKGVMVEHRNVLGLVINNSYAPIGPQDCVAHGASPSFDATTWEVWSALLNGARLLIVPQCVVLDPVALNRTLTQFFVTAMWLTVGLFNEYVDALEEGFGGLRYLLVGGDALVPALIARAMGKKKPPQHVLNGYGPTETTTFAATFEIKFAADHTSSIPIGGPIANTRIFILNEERELVPVGAIGEIYIGGAGVSRGYLSQKTLTDERFVPDPFGSDADARLYRSGDLGRWRPDGMIEYLGRHDSQVKIRGFRVELGEVESTLHSFPGVRQAVALALEEEPGIKRLVAYLVPELSELERLELGADRAMYDAKIGGLIESLRDYLRNKLPPHMVPAILVPLEEFPLTENGKVDRRALPALKGRQFLPQGYVAATTPTEETLSIIWKQVLKVERVGVEDNFFELGGDSLLGIDMIGQSADTLNAELPFMAVLQYPTVRQLAQYVDGLRTQMAEHAGDSAASA